MANATPRMVETSRGPVSSEALGVLNDIKDLVDLLVEQGRQMSAHAGRAHVANGIDGFVRSLSDDSEATEHMKLFALRVGKYMRERARSLLAS